MILLKGTPYTLGTPFTNDQGTQFPGNWYSFATPEQRLQQGFTEVPDPPPVDERFYYVNTDGSIAEKPLEQCKQVVISELANLRWSKENKGITYANNIFATDRESRVNYVGALTQASANNQYTVRWKVYSIDDKKSKFVTLDANDVIYIYSYGIDYITKCFDKEDELIELINQANTLNTLININITSDWPNNNY